MFWSPKAKQSGTNDDDSRWLSRDQLERCLQENGCLVCRALARFERKDIHSFLYEGMMFPAVRRQFIAPGGFCHRHFWTAMKIEDECWPAGGFGMAMLCEDLLRLASDALTRSANPDTRISGTNRKGEELFRPGGSCVFCKDSAETEMVFMDLLEELVGEPSFRNAVEAHGSAYGMASWLRLAGDRKPRERGSPRQGRSTLAAWQKLSANSFGNTTTATAVKGLHRGKTRSWLQSRCSSVDNGGLRRKGSEDEDYHHFRLARELRCAVGLAGIRRRALGARRPCELWTATARGGELRPYSRGRCRSRKSRPRSRIRRGPALHPSLSRDGQREDSDRWQQEVGTIQADYLLVGHTHRPLIKRVGQTTVVNPGSLGQPKTGKPDACYAVWQDGHFELKQFPYALERALERIQHMPVPAEIQRDLSTVLRTGSV